MPSKKRTRKSRKQAKGVGRANIVVNVNSHNKRKSTVVKKDGGGGGGGNPLIMPIPFPQYLPQQQTIQHHLSQPTRLPFLADQNIQNARTMNDSVREQGLMEAQIQNRILQAEKQQLMQKMKAMSKAMPPEDNPFELNSMRGNVHQDSVLDREAFLPVGETPSYTPQTPTSPNRGILHGGVTPASQQAQREIFITGTDGRPRVLNPESGNYILANTRKAKDIIRAYKQQNQ